MNSWLTLIQIDIRLAFRQRTVIFFNYLLPLAFFFIFAQVYRAQQGGMIVQVLTMVIVIGVLGNGLLGAGIRAAQDRETNILRRYKVAPISPLPLLVASTVTGLIVYLPSMFVILAISKWRYGLVLPQHMAAMIVFVILGVTAFRAIGLMVASVVNSMQESGIIVQILYTGMLFLSGATFPTSIFPGWLLTVTQFIPANWLMTGLQGIILRNETLRANWQGAAALILTTIIGLLLCVKLFRWEKEEKMRPAAKLWLVAVLLPFVLLGGWQSYARDNERKIRILDRDLARSRTVLIRNARIFIGDGRVIENGAVLVSRGRIAEVYDGSAPDPKQLNAEPLEAAGKTILPGLIDVHVHLAAPAGIYDDWKAYDGAKMMRRNLAAYLYSGVTAVRSAGDQLDMALATRTIVNSGQQLGAEFFLAGPLFTAPGGHGTEILRDLPDAIREQAQAQFTRLPATSNEARQQVDALKKAGVDAIKAVLEGGAGGTVFKRLDLDIFNAIAAQGHKDNLPVIVHTGDNRDVEDALRANINGIEHGSFRTRIPDADFAAMARAGITYDPTLSVAEAARDFAAGKLELLDRSLVQQVGPSSLLAGTRNAITAAQHGQQFPADLDIARDNLLRAYRAGVILITGSDAGNMLVFHGPTVQHEIQLWVDAGIPVEAVLQAATLNSARALRVASRLGSIEKGKDANMLVVDGNPLQDIKATESISLVMFKGERVDRSELFRQAAR